MTLKQSENVFLSVQRLCNMVLCPSQHTGCDLLCLSNTYTGIISKGKDVISAITGLWGFSHRVGEKQKQSPQLPQPQSMETGTITCFCDFLEHSPLVSWFHLHWVAPGCSSESSTPSAWPWCLWEHPQVCSSWPSPQLWQDKEFPPEPRGFKKHFSSTTSPPGHAQELRI